MYKKVLAFMVCFAVVALVCLRFFYGGRGSIVVGVLPDYPPFSHRSSESDELVGFDIDMIKAIGKNVKRNVEFRVASLPDLLSALRKKEIHLIVSGVPVSFVKHHDMKKLLSYVKYDVLVVDDYDCLVQPASADKASITRIGVQEGTSEEVRALESKSFSGSAGTSVNFVKGDSMKGLIGSLLGGKLDAVYMSFARFSYLESTKGSGYKCSRVEAGGASKAGLGANVEYAMIFLSNSRSGKSIKRKVEKGLKMLEDSGEYDAMRVAWVTGYSGESLA